MLRAATVFLCALVPLVAADFALLKLIPPDANVIAGARVDRAKDSVFGRYVLTHMQSDDPEFQRFVADTGFDALRDASEVVMASKGAGIKNHGVVIARGNFNASKMTDAVVFLDPTTVVLGDPDAVKAVVARHASKPVSALLDGAREASAGNDFWFATTAPLAEFAAKMPDAALGDILQKLSMLPGIAQVSGGLRFGETVVLNAEVLMDSEKNAEGLADVLRFVASFVQTSVQEDPAAVQMAAMLGGMVLKTDGRLVHLTLKMPEAQIEKVLAAAGQDKL